MDPFSIGGAIQTGLSTVAKIFNTVKDNTTAYYGNTSLPEATKLCRVEPLTIVSRDLLNKPETKTVLNAQLSIFAAQYLQAIDLLTKVQDVEVVRILDKLNPDRDEMGFLMSNPSDKKFGFESYDYMNAEKYAHRLPTASMPALEASGGGDSSQSVELDTLANLSFGRLINVKIQYNKEGNEDKARSVTVPMNIRLMVSSVPNDTISKIMTYKNQDLSLIERIHTARSGRIEFIRDLVFCRDLIDEYKRATIHDKNNILSEITRRANNAKKFGLLTGNPSLVVASTLFVISDTVARDIQEKLGGKLDNPRVRDIAFENTYAMMIAVVSAEWETVTFYTRGIARGATFSFKELEGKTKGNGPDIGDLLKALTSGQPPSF